MHHSEFDLIALIRNVGKFCSERRCLSRLTDAYFFRCSNGADSGVCPAGVDLYLIAIKTTAIANTTISTMARIVGEREPRGGRCSDSAHLGVSSGCWLTIDIICRAFNRPVAFSKHQRLRSFIMIVSGFTATDHLINAIDGTDNLDFVEQRRI